MPRSGTLVICVQNLDFSGANQVVLNIVAGRTHYSNVIVLSPKIGTFAARFVEGGAAVRVGNLKDLLEEIRDVFCIICNTIMTADIVVEMSERPFPIVWILHEWWDDEMIRENLKIRNYQGLTLDVVKKAMALSTKIVFVCEAQRKLYNPRAPSCVIYVGVPDPSQRTMLELPQDSLNFKENRLSTGSLPSNGDSQPFVFLCLGIICPRKNQLWTAQLFKKFCKGKSNVKLLMVGARCTRVYEIEYLKKVQEEIDNDPSIEIRDVTDNVEVLYRQANCLILTSLNEVTPMVISEAMSWGLPVLSTNIAGIPEMLTDGVEGFLFSPGDDNAALQKMNMIYSNSELRKRMGNAAREKFESFFDLDLMVDYYRKLLMKVSPPTILIDMDGALIDWDAGFFKVWNNRSPIDRSKSYYMENCIDPEFKEIAERIFHEQGFFESLEPMEGSLEAVREMEREGFKIYICTAPILSSKYCAQEKLNWICKHFGKHWLEKVILCYDKTMASGDLLIDDKPYEFLSPGGKHTTATWKQIIFDAPYNRQKQLPRLFKWKHWRQVVYPMLGKLCPLDTLSSDEEKFEHKLQFDSLGLAKLVTSKLFLNNNPEAIQKHMDMLSPSITPLCPEDMATIVSESLSLIDDEDSMEEELEEKKNFPLSDSFTMKKKELQNKLFEKNEMYLKTKDSIERKMALDSDSMDIEGLLLFRPAYEQWKNTTK